MVVEHFQKYRPSEIPQVVMYEERGQGNFQALKVNNWTCNLVKTVQVKPNECLDSLIVVILKIGLVLDLNSPYLAVTRCTDSKICP